MAKLISVNGKSPQIDKTVFLAENAVIIGDVTIGPESSVWFNVVIRGDVSAIKIGKQTNIQDNTVIHGTYGKYGVEIGDRVTVGHSVVLHGCTIKNKVLVGMGSIVMDGAVIEENSVVGAGSLVTEQSRLSEGALSVGRPAKEKRPLNQKEKDFLDQSAENYILYQSWYKADSI